jgi:hypothetical protein
MVFIKHKERNKVAGHPTRMKGGKIYKEMNSASNRHDQIWTLKRGYPRSMSPTSHGYASFLVAAREYK